MIVDGWDGWYFHLDCFVADNFNAGLLEEENTHFFLFYLFSLLFFKVKLHTDGLASRRFRIILKEEAPIDSLFSLPLTLSLLPMKYVLICLKIGIQGSRGRRIQLPGTIKLDSGRIKMPGQSPRMRTFFPVGRPKIVTKIATTYLALKFNPPLVDPVIACLETTIKNNPNQPRVTAHYVTAQCK